MSEIGANVAYKGETICDVLIMHTETIFKPSKR
jgi:hypothetical protein